MKKEYIKPEINTVVVEAMMICSSPLSVKPADDEDKVYMGEDIDDPADDGEFWAD